MTNTYKRPAGPEYRAALVFSFLTPVLIMILVFIARGIFPFGDASFLRTDMYHQYALFFQEFREKLTSGESLLYSWNIGGGTNFSALFAYYLASPFNWLIVLVPRAYVIEFMTYLIVLKIGLAGLTFTWYLSRHCRTGRFSICLFGIAYALSGYMAAYSWNIMWLDCIFLLPLIVLGLERLVRDNRCFLYSVTLGLSILSNYYISIMTCIFLVLYFVFLVLTQEERTLRNVLRQTGCFALFSLLAGGIAAIVLLPEIYALGTTASSNSTFPQDISSYFSILEMLARHLDVVEVEIGLDHWPNLFCGVAVFLLIPLYVMNRRYSYKEKIGYFVLIFFFLASFSLNVLNFIWHGLHYPNSLPCRQSFLYIFLVLVMSCKGFLGIRERSPRQILTALWIAVGLVLVFQAVCDDEAISWASIWISLIFIGAYALLIYLSRRKGADRILLALFAFTAVVTENSLNTNMTSVTTVTRSVYKDIDEATAELKAQMEENDAGFYRMEKVSHRTKNDGAWLTYPSASTFSSMSCASMSSFYREMGMEGSTNSFSTNGASPFTYSLLSVRYLLATEELPESPLYTKTGTALYPASSEGLPDRQLYLYENLYTLPLGFVLPSDMTDWNFSASTPFEEQDSFVSAATGVSSIFQVIGSQSGGSQCTIPVTESGTVYLYITGSTEDVSVTHGSFSKTFSDVNRGYLLNVGYCEEGESILITSTDSEDTVRATAAVFLEDAFIEAYEELSAEPMNVENISSGHVTASLTTEGGLLVTTIPYDEGWSLKVDGVSVRPQVFADTFLCFSIGAGTHTLEFDYTPQGFTAGIVISAASLAALLALWFAVRLWKRYRPIRLNWNEEELTHFDELFDRIAARGLERKAAEEKAAAEANGEAEEARHGEDSGETDKTDAPEPASAHPEEEDIQIVDLNKENN